MPGGVLRCCQWSRDVVDEIYVAIASDRELHSWYHRMPENVALGISILPFLVCNLRWYSPTSSTTDNTSFISQQAAEFHDLELCTLVKHLTTSQDSASRVVAA